MEAHLGLDLELEAFVPRLVGVVVWMNMIALPVCCWYMLVQGSSRQPFEVGKFGFACRILLVSLQGQI